MNGKAIIYMFRVIHQELTLVNIKYDFKRNIYRPNYELLVEEFQFEPPILLLDKMAQLGKTLAKPFEFVRIDFMLNKIYFSEYTFTPNAGIQTLPDYLEIEQGKLWH